MGIPEIDIAAFADLHAQGVTVVDVRNPDEYEAAHVPGVVLVPMAEIPERVADIPEDRTVYLICAMGGRSRKVGEFLAAQGRDVVNVAGGTQGWIESGLPIERGGPAKEPDRD